MKGYRIFERFGFNLPKEEKPAPTPARLVREYTVWEYDLKSKDWINAEHKSALTGYVPPPQLLSILDDNIDLESE